MKKLSESRKQLLNDKEQSSPVVRISKKQFEDLAAAAYALGLTIPEAIKLAIKNWLTLTPSQALGISKEELYRMAELDGVKIGA
jgi:AraC-like DNA-binding protein